MFGLSIEKLLLVAIIAAALIGPTRLPIYAAHLGAFVRGAGACRGRGRLSPGRQRAMARNRPARIRPATHRPRRHA